MKENDRGKEAERRKGDGKRWEECIESNNTERLTDLSLEGER